MILKQKQQAFFVNDQGGFLLGLSIAYCPRKNLPGDGDMVMIYDCMEKSDGVKYSQLCRSQDGGKTWQKQCIFDHCFAYDKQGSMQRNGYGGFYADPEQELLFYFGSELFWEQDNLNSTWYKRKIYTRISYDNGYTWTDKIQIIQKGEEYNSIHYMNGVTFGKNMACFVVSHTFKDTDGNLIVGIQSQIADENGELINPTGMGYLQCGNLKGIWNEESQGYEWEFGEWKTVSLDISTRGLYEPSNAQLANGNMIMIMRGSNYKREDELTGCKFICSSTDGAMSWTEPVPLLYEDGSVMFSSSSSSKILTHSNGKLYFIGMICDENPKGNLPRYPLCIAEIDQNSCRVIKSSVTVIDTKPDEVDDTIEGNFPIDFSNHWVYEEKESGNIITFAPFRPDLTKLDGYLNRYTIEV